MGEKVAQVQVQEKGRLDRAKLMVRRQANPRVEKSTLMSGIKQSLLLVVPGSLSSLLSTVSSSAVLSWEEVRTVMQYCKIKKARNLTPANFHAMV